jgi:hypothetical protein
MQLADAAQIQLPASDFTALYVTSPLAEVTVNPGCARPHPFCLGVPGPMPAQLPAAILHAQHVPSRCMRCLQSLPLQALPTEPPAAAISGLSRR